MTFVFTFIVSQFLPSNNILVWFQSSARDIMSEVAKKQPVTFAASVSANRTKRQIGACDSVFCAVFLLLQYNMPK